MANLFLGKQVKTQGTFPHGLHMTPKSLVCRETVEVPWSLHPSHLHHITNFHSLIHPHHFLQAAGDLRPRIYYHLYLAVSKVLFPLSREVKQGESTYIIPEHITNCIKIPHTKDELDDEMPGVDKVWWNVHALQENFFKNEKEQYKYFR